MKPMLLALLLPLTLTGCMVELLTSTAIQGELAAKDAVAAKNALNYAKESKAKTEAEQAIRTYQAEKGTYPPSLTALVPSYLPGVPVHADGSPFGYDPSSGRLLDGPAAQAQVPFTEEDGRNLRRIEDAIYAYWQATGNYPQTLDDLDPLYIEQVPSISAGGSFIYNPQNGGVYHPNDFASAPAAAGSTRSVGGAGPLSEVTTGIAIQNDLRNMNTSGTSNAGSAARRNIQGVNNAYNQQQERALRDLDQ